MSDWNKLVNFSNSKQANAILFLIVCVILVIVLFRQQPSNYIGGQRGGNKMSYFLTIVSAAVTFFCIYVFYVLVIATK